MTAPADNPMTLPGMPEPPAPTPKAGDLVAAWCQGWTASHDGEQPHPSVVRRVAGICRNVAKDCDDIDAWRDAWRAAVTAGGRGRFDVIGELAAPNTASATTRGNHFLSIAREVGGGPQIGG